MPSWRRPVHELHDSPHPCTIGRLRRAHAMQCENARNKRARPGSVALRATRARIIRPTAGWPPTRGHIAEDERRRRRRPRRGRLEGNARPTTRRCRLRPAAGRPPPRRGACGQPRRAALRMQARPSAPARERAVALFSHTELRIPARGNTPMTHTPVRTTCCHRRADGRDASLGIPSASLSDDCKEVRETGPQNMQLSAC